MRQHLKNKSTVYLEQRYSATSLTAEGHIREINTRIGLFVPEIITPLELFEE